MLINLTLTFSLILLIADLTFCFYLLIQHLPKIRFGSDSKYVFSVSMTLLSMKVLGK